MLAIEYHVRLWQVSLQLKLVKYECDAINLTDTFGRIEIFAFGEINERTFRNSNPEQYGYRNESI